MILNVLIITMEDNIKVAAGLFLEIMYFHGKLREDKFEF